MNLVNVQRLWKLRFAGASGRKKAGLDFFRPRERLFFVKLKLITSAIYRVNYFFIG
jgi:hypothetical protein